MGEDKRARGLYVTNFLVIASLGVAFIIVTFGILSEVHEELTTRWFIDADQAVITFLHGYASPRVTAAMLALSLAGAPQMLWPVVGAGFAWLLLRGSRREAIIFATAVGGASLINLGLKLWFARPRPNPTWVLAHETSYSFPSGHAVAAVAFYGSLTFLLWRRAHSRGVAWLLIVAAALFIFGIGISRIYLGVHYPTDVAAGYLVGLLWLMAVILGSKHLVAQRGRTGYSETARRG